MRSLFGVALLSGILSLPAAAFQNDFHWTGQLAPGQTITIKGVNGGIHAEAAAGSAIEVSAVKKARHSDPNLVKVEMVPGADGVTICAVYPDDGSAPNTCGSGSGYHMNTRDNDVEVEFTVKVPAGIRLSANTVNGSIVAQSLQSEVAAHTVNGSINVSTTQLAEAHTVNGSIHATMGDGAATALDFSTVNGNIELTLPSTLNADVHAKTVSGAITSDFQVAVSGRIGRHSLDGRIGAGGRSLKLSTVNGTITLRNPTTAGM